MNVFKFVFLVFLVIGITIYLGVSVNNSFKEECLSITPPFDGGCFKIERNLSIEELDWSLNALLNLTEMEYKKQIMNDTMIFSLTNNKGTVIFSFKNNTNKIIRTGYVNY